jgi:hypothetical protein
MSILPGEIAKLTVSLICGRADNSCDAQESRTKAGRRLRRTVLFSEQVRAGKVFVRKLLALRLSLQRYER